MSLLFGVKQSVKNDFRPSRRFVTLEIHTKGNNHVQKQFARIFLLLFALVIVISGAAEATRAQSPSFPTTTELKPAWRRQSAYCVVQFAVYAT